MAGLLRVEDAVHAGRLRLGDLHPGARLVWLRATILGGSAAGVGTLSHLAGDGLLPGWPALLALVLSAVSVAGVLVLTRATRTRIVLALVGGQALMHLLLSSLGGHRGASTGVDAGFWQHQVDHLAATGPAMVLAHTAGAVGLGLFLAFGEQALWRHLVSGVLTRHLLALLSARRLVDVRTDHLPRRAGAGAHRPRFSATPAQQRPGLARRGPPLLLAD